MCEAGAVPREFGNFSGTPRHADDPSEMESTGYGFRQGVQAPSGTKYGGRTDGTVCGTITVHAKLVVELAGLLIATVLRVDGLAARRFVNHEGSSTTFVNPGSSEGLRPSGELPGVGVLASNGTIARLSSCCCCSTGGGLVHRRVSSRKSRSSVE